MRHGPKTFSLVIVLVLGLVFVIQVNAFASFCKWNKSQVSYFKDLPSNRLAAADMAATAWSNLPTPMILISTLDSNTADILIDHANEGGGTGSKIGRTIPTCDNGFFVGRQRIIMNDYYVESEDGNPFNSPYSEQEYTMAVAHELGHALGLSESNVLNSLMCGEPRTDCRPCGVFTCGVIRDGIFVPVYDDIRGLASLYGLTNSGKFCCVLTYTYPFVSVNSTELPLRLRILRSEQNRYAMAYSTGSLPSSHLALMIAEVNPTTLYKFSMGWLTSQDPTDQVRRFATVELDNDGIKLVYTRLGGPTEARTLFNNPTAGTTYFLELVVRLEGGVWPRATAYAFDRYGQWLGFAESGSHHWNWADPNTFGVSVWTDSSSSPGSDYTVNEFWNWQNPGGSLKASGGGFGTQIHFTTTPSDPIPGSPVTFTSVGVGGFGPYTYAWNFGDGYTGTGNPVSHTYAKSGDYTVTLARTDFPGTVSVFSRVVHVSSSNSGGGGVPRPIGPQ